MSQWPSTKARLVLAALLRIGWTVKRQSGTSHRLLWRPGWPDYAFAFHDQEEIGPSPAQNGRNFLMLFLEGNEEGWVIRCSVALLVSSLVTRFGVPLNPSTNPDTSCPTATF